MVRKKAANVNKRKKLNNWYNKLDLDGKAVFITCFVKILRDKYSNTTAIGMFISGKKIQMP
jgi:hypothetical protein